MVIVMVMVVVVMVVVQAMLGTAHLFAPNRGSKLSAPFFRAFLRSFQVSFF